MTGYTHMAEHYEDNRNLAVHMQEWADTLSQENIADVRKSFVQEKQSIRQREQLSDILLPAVYLRVKKKLSDLIYELMMLSYIYEMDGTLCFDYQKKYGQRVPDFQYGMHILSCCSHVDSSILCALCDKQHLLWEIFEWQETEDSLLLSKKMILKKAVVYFLTTASILLPEEVMCWPPDNQEWFPVHAPLWQKLSRTDSTDYPYPILLCGRKGSGRKSLIKRLGQEHNKSILYMKAKQIYSESRETRQKIAANICLACTLMPFILAIDCEAIEGKEEAGWLAEWIDSPLKHWEMYLVAENGKEAGAAAGLSQTMFCLKDFLTLEDMKAVLVQKGEEQYLSDREYHRLLRYRFSIGELLDRLACIRLERKWNDQRISGEEGKSRWYRNQKENYVKQGMGEIIDMPCYMEEFVGSSENKELLQRLIQISAGWQNTIREWNEGGESYREGLLLLFYGTSGTGKTMSASILATELGMPLFKINLSEIFDKYIGETEKHLEEILRIAESNNYILFFDEADALFSKRTQVNDSHDKYANLSTSYLLQRLERYPGIVVLATNLQQNLDDAFLRRIRFVVKFLPLDASQRAILWQQVLDKADGIAADISIEQLAQKVPLSPARIKEAALTAMVLARQEGSGIVTREQLLWAIRLEASKDETLIDM